MFAIWLRSRFMSPGMYTRAPSCGTACSNVAACAVCTPSRGSYGADERDLDRGRDRGRAAGGGGECEQACTATRQRQGCRQCLGLVVDTKLYREGARVTRTDLNAGRAVSGEPNTLPGEREDLPDGESLTGQRVTE